MKKKEHPTPDEDGAKRRSDLDERMLAHAARIVDLYDSLPAGSGAKQIGDQLIRSGTSPFLRHGEVQSADSRDDFVRRLEASLKDLRETWRALRLLQRIAKLPKSAEADLLIEDTLQLIRIFYDSVRTARQRNEPTSRIQEDAPGSSDWKLAVGHWMLDDTPPPPP